ncbi:hybrid sensor histidine kinase/response regulator transcription factor [Mediterranea massiliensis]|uniref:hybrid sensor histidine kinase/response regulator transcription factor n=1 Tax=Mediterranea massiliensis TaxID=1841865 RepID=UPI0025A32A0F|nr:hybrid sensor histidine kinase/response regulator transcription factor [Mediterranea massiliensis]MDM8335907.1 response regulator [Mediterranea massiliensis]
MKARKYFFLHLALAIFVLSATPALLNAKHYLYKQILLNTGLPTTLTCISSDTKGFVWSGTKFGLGRFDGHEQKRYLHVPDDSTSLPGNNIYQIMEDSKHHLWILTDMGVARYNYRNNNFIPLKDEHGQPCIAYSICQWKDLLLLGGANKVYSYDLETKELKVFYKLKHYNRFEIMRLAVTQHDVLLCCSRWEGIYALNLNNGRINASPFRCGKEISDMFIDSKQRIWIAPYNQGLRCFTSRGKEVASYTTQNSELSSNIVLCITEKEGQIWMGTDGGGINILDADNNRFAHLKHLPGDKIYSLPTNSINCIYRDLYDNIWMGGVYNGLINMREVSMKTYTDVPFGYPLGLSHNIVISLYQESPQRIWIGTDGGGINSFNPTTETFTHYPATREDKITSICDFTPGKLLFSAFAEGLYVFDIASGTKTPFYVIDKDITQDISQHGYSVYLYRNTPNTILILSDHVYIYNLHNKTFQIAIENDKEPITWGSLQAIASDENRTYLFDSKRIYTMDHSTLKLTVAFTPQKETIINSVAYDKQGNFWIGTNQGLELFRSATGKSTSIQSNLFTDVSLVVYHNPDEIWIGAENMLFSYSPSKERFTVYGESDGVMPNEYVPRSQLVIEGQGIYMGGVEGLLFIANDQKTDVISQPEIQLSDIILNGKSINDKLAKNQDAIAVRRNSNVVIQIMAKEEDIFRRRLYRYRVEGLDNSYTETYQPELVMHTQLPGTYRIMASCTAKDGSWVPDRQILTLTILPPWYQTWWFVLLSATLGVLLVIGLFRKMLKRKERELKWAMKEHEQQVYEEKVRFLINISHELRTPLTLIYAPLKRILKAIGPDNEQYQPLKAIYRQSQRMKALINMVLDLRKMEVGESKLHLQPLDINAWIGQVSQDFASEGEAEQVHITYNLAPGIGNVSFDKEKCEIILSNLLVNALKHSPKNSTINITSELTADGQVRISIADQGCGLKQVNMDKLFKRFYQAEGEQNGTGIGLSYSKILVEQHGGKIGAYNNPAGGATFYFELPLRHEQAEIVSQPKAYLNELITDEGIEPTISSENSFDTSAYTVLVADDHPEMLDFLKKALGEHFKQVITAADGMEVLQLARKHLPDIIVSDVMMPRMNGYQLCQQLKQDISISHIPVILLTARDDEQSRKEGYKNGADAYLAKPFEEDTLLELIRNRLKNRSLIRERYLQAGPVPVPEEATFSQADEAFLSKLNKIILDNLDNCDLDIAVLCQQMHVSRASLYNKMKALTNISANEYINKTRLEKAIQLIVNTNMPFTEIAEKVGFATSSYFSTAFKQYTGETPTQYKKRIRQKPAENEQAGRDRTPTDDAPRPLS